MKTIIRMFRAVDDYFRQPMITIRTYNPMLAELERLKALLQDLECRL